MSVATKEDTKKGMVPSPKQELAGAEATRPGPTFSPLVDIFETDAAITVLADLPGVRPGDLAIDLRESVLTIDATVREMEAPEEREVLREYETGSFHREFRLSRLIDQSRIDAELRDGVLRLTLPKAEQARPRKIEIKVG